jgi:hypothetical protein
LIIETLATKALNAIRVNQIIYTSLSGVHIKNRTVIATNRFGLGARSGAPENVNQLRDPCLFEVRDGELYVIYTAAGEDALGLLHLEFVNSGAILPPRR